MADFKVILENENWIAVDKPSGMLTVPSRQGAADERACLKSLVQTHCGQQIWAIHRLDVEVSGVVLFGKTAEFHKKACAAFEDHTAKKTYQALTVRGSEFRGEVGQEWTWRMKLVRGKRRAFEAPHGKLAITRARLEREFDSRLQWTLWPETGRSHQLRVSLAKVGCPILGDQLYGSKEEFDGIALRATALKIAALDIDLMLPGELTLPAK